MSRKLAKLAWVVLLAACGAPGDGDGNGKDTADAIPGFSYIGNAIIKKLRDSSQDKFQATWGDSGGNGLNDGWLIQTPREDHWGQPYAAMNILTPCTGDTCDAEFVLQKCETQDDCTMGGECRDVLSSVKNPGD